MQTIRAILIAIIFASAPLSALFIGYGLMLSARSLPLAVFLIGCFSVAVACLGVAALLDERQESQSQRERGQ